jgi:transposase
MTTVASTPRQTLGLDVSDRFISYCLVDEMGEMVEEGRVRSTEAAIRQRFAGPPCRVVLEAGTHSPWLSRLLTDAGHEVVVANPRRVQLIAQSTRKNDRSDAETLARLGRLDPTLLRPIRHRSAEAQVDLAALRARNALVAARTLLINHVRGAVKSLGERLPACDAHSFHRRAKDALPASGVVALTPLVDTIGRLTEQIREMDCRLADLAATRYPEARLLQQVPGVGQLISLAFVLTIGDPGRFKTSREVGPFLGLVPRQRESGDSAPELRISKAGDGYLRQLLVQGAQYVLGYRGPDSDLRRWGLEKAAGGKRAKKRAVVAVARKLAILLHRLWVTGEVYRPLRVQPVAA